MNMFSFVRYVCIKFLLNTNSKTSVMLGTSGVAPISHTNLWCHWQSFILFTLI